jgi:hypothetical protein
MLSIVLTITACFTVCVFTVVGSFAFGNPRLHLFCLPYTLFGEQQYLIHCSRWPH